LAGGQGAPIADNVAGLGLQMWNTWDEAHLNVAGVIGSGVYFDGTSDNPLVNKADPNLGVTQQASNFTIALWVNPDGAAENWDRIIDAAPNAGGNPDTGYRLNFDNTGSANFATNGTSIIGDTIGVDVWNLLVVRFDGSGNVSLNVLTAGDTVNAAFVGTNAAKDTGVADILYTDPAGHTKFGAQLSNSGNNDYKGYITHSALVSFGFFANSVFIVRVFAESCLLVVAWCKWFDQILVPSDTKALAP